jgi:mannose-6-phosphate isomerase-like protein (cupin superfamily)
MRDATHLDTCNQSDVLLRQQPLYLSDLEKTTLENTAYRRVLHTTNEQQFVLMNLKPAEEIGKETHPHTTQFIRIEDGNGIAVMDDVIYSLRKNSAMTIPANTEHNVVAGLDGLKLYAIYSPPHHLPGTHQEDKPSAS